MVHRKTENLDSVCMWIPLITKTWRPQKFPESDPWSVSACFNTQCERKGACQIACQHNACVHLCACVCVWERTYLLTWHRDQASIHLLLQRTLLAAITQTDALNLWHNRMNCGHYFCLISPLRCSNTCQGFASLLGTGGWPVSTLVCVHVCVCVCVSVYRCGGVCQFVSRGAYRTRGAAVGSGWMNYSTLRRS